MPALDSALGVYPRGGTFVIRPTSESLLSMKTKKSGGEKSKGGVTKAWRY